MLNLWYKNAIIYCVDVDVFMDSDGDGIGDFAGLAHRLDHIEALGATCVWLLPFYPSPDRDNGYDIMDYYNVDPRLGTLGDFVEFAQAAEDRGLRVIVDLVVNHTSIDHPWFQAARDPKSEKHDWYIWSDEKPPDAEEGIIFPGVQTSTWTYDRKAGKYYFHRFYKHQADLNISNPAVREEITRIMGFWLQLGVSGFRIDAVPFLIEDLKKIAHADWTPESYLTDMQCFLSWRRAEAIMLAEANIPMEKADEYFGNGDRMHLIFNFPLNQRLFLSLARGEAAPLETMLQELPEIPPVGQWATFLRNHDEIDLGRLSDAERQEVFASMGPRKDMQLYDRGIRRRLAPMLGGDTRRIAMAFSLMLSLPGTPVIWYGDEIGMGDNLALAERNAVRTPMQWNDGHCGGFSKAEPADCVREPVPDGPYAAEHVNVAAQRFNESSLMECVQRLIRVRRSAPEVGWGECRIVKTNAPSVLGMISEWRGDALLTLHNLSDQPAVAALPDEVDPGKTTPLIGDADFTAAGHAGSVRLDAYGYCWLRLSGERR